MKDVLKVITGWKPKKVITTIVFSLVFLLVIFVLLKLTRYTTPYYDDYGYGAKAHFVHINGGNFFDVIKASGDNAMHTYRTWQGTFSSAFLMGLMPGIWGEQYYFLGPAFLICIFALSIFVFVGTMASGILKSDIWDSFSLRFLAAIFMLTLIYSAQQGFYWFNGGVHYVGAHSFMILECACLISYLFSSNGNFINVIVYVASVVLSILVSGSNYVTSLQGVLALGTILLVTVYTRNKRIIHVLPVYCVYIIGFLLNALAPGNSVRGSYFAGYGYSAPMAIIKSFEQAVVWFPRFTGFATLLFLLLALPIIYRIVKKTEFDFKHPIIVILWSVCFYATGFTSSLYTMGGIDLDRLINVIKITLQVVLLLDEIYLCGYVCRKMEKRKVNMSEGFVPWWSYLVWALAFVLVFSLTEDKIGNYSPYGAYFYMDSGFAQYYRNAYLLRVEALTSGEKDVTVKSYLIQPWFLSQTQDLHEEPEAEINKVTAYYYWIDSVRRDPDNTY